MWRLIIVGVACVALSAALGHAYCRRAGIPPRFRPYTAGTGIVPKWLSFVNLGGWALLVAGVLGLCFR